MGREGKAADGHRAGEFREPSGGSVRDSEQKPRGGRITALPERIGAAAASEGAGGSGGAWAGTGSGKHGMMKGAGAESRGFTGERQHGRARRGNSQSRQESQGSGTLRERSPETHRGVRRA